MKHLKASTFCIMRVPSKAKLIAFPESGEEIVLQIGDKFFSPQIQWMEWKTATESGIGTACWTETDGIEPDNCGIEIMDSEMTPTWNEN